MRVAFVGVQAKYWYRRISRDGRPADFFWLDPPAGLPAEQEASGITRTFCAMEIFGGPSRPPAEI